MPTTFYLKGSAQLTSLPDQLEDFQLVVAVVDDTCGRDAILFIRDGELFADIDESEASHSTYNRLRAALDDFLTKHGADGSVFELEDDETWFFGPTPQAKWQAQFDHLQSLAIAADEALGEWLERNPAPGPEA